MKRIKNEDVIMKERRYKDVITFEGICYGDNIKRKLPQIYKFTKLVTVFLIFFLLKALL